MTNQQLLNEINTLLSKGDNRDLRIEADTSLPVPTLVTLRLYRGEHYRTARTIELKPGQPWKG